MTPPLRRPRRLAVAGAMVAAAFVWGSIAVAQTPAASRSYVEGRVLIGGPAERPVPGVWVALNRVGDDSAGVIDSVRSAPDGSYRFSYAPTGDPEAVYFTDVTYGGVSYFADPFRAARVVGDAAHLYVFDTTSAAGRLNLRGRHIVVGALASDGRRPMVEVFELTNDTTLTIVAAGGVRPVWSIALPPDAADLEVQEGDLGPEVVRFRDARLELFAPMSPGLRQLSVRYTLPGDAFPLRVALPQPPDVLEILLSQRDGFATGAGLHEEQPVTLEGQPFKRYLSQNTRAERTITIVVSGSGGAASLVVPVAVACTLAVFAGALVHVRRRPLALA